MEIALEIAHSAKCDVATCVAISNEHLIPYIVLVLDLDVCFLCSLYILIDLGISIFFSNT